MTLIFARERQTGKPPADHVKSELDNTAQPRIETFWEQFRATKIYDLLCALPLMLWLGLALHAQSELLMRRATELYSGTIDLRESLQFAAILGSALFNLAVIYFLIVRTTPIARSKGVLPRITAFVGAFFGTSILLLPVAELTLTTEIVSNLLIFGGCGTGLFVLTRLGRAFAVLPEARELNTNGPYALARHPLYATELITYLGLTLQFQQPWAFMILIAGSVIMFVRSTFEERVLEEKFQHYAAYRARTSRFLPGIF